MVLIVLVLILVPTLSSGQEWGETPQARVELGPLGLSPRFTVQTGIDDNVFNDAVDARSDIAVTTRAGVQTWLGKGRTRFSGSTQADYSFFKQYENQRGLGSSTNGQVEFALHRVRPYVGGSFVNAFQRPSLEVDTRARRREVAVEGGVEVRLSDRFSVDTAVYRQNYAIADDTSVEAALGSALNRRTDRTLAALRYIYSPLTRVSMVVTSDRDRFESQPGAVARNLRIAPAIEFSPLALVTGHAEIGYLKFRPTMSAIESFNGIVTSVELNYVLLGRTRLSGRVSREPSYSAQAASVYYVQTSLGGSFATLITEQFDIRGSWDRNLLSYRALLDDVPIDSSAGSSTFVHAYGASIGYRLGRNTRLALNADFNRRISPGAQRDYESLKIYSAMTYGS
jgi:hypothetical protein